MFTVLKNFGPACDCARAFFGPWECRTHAVLKNLEGDTMNGHRRAHLWRTLRDVAADPYFAIMLVAAGALWIWDRIRRVVRWEREA